MRCIAIDVMGGDKAPQAIMDGVASALAGDLGDFKLLLVGLEDVVKSELQRIGRSNDPRVEIVPATQVVGMDEPAVAAIRSKKDSSLNVAAELVKEGRAHAFFSAGNTGALVSSAVLRLRNLPGIQKPAIAVTMPTTTGEFILLDAGAVVDCKPEHLVQFAIMGDVYARLLHGKPNPKVGLLNVGSEEMKGNELTREVHGLLKALPGINFIGNIEANEMFAGKADVVVCDGFVGNIVLKTSEGLPRAIFGLLKEELTRNPLRAVGAFLAKPAFMAIRKRMNPDEYGGAAILGVNGVCVKGHGSSKARAVECAIQVVRRTVDLGVNQRIVERIQQLGLVASSQE